MGLRKTPPPLPELVDDREAWRLEQLKALGYDHADAVRVAKGYADLHAIANLVGNGCPLPLALRITD